MKELYNIKNTQLFTTKLQEILNGMYDFFELTFEKEYPKETDGIVHIVNGKTCFLVNGKTCFLVNGKTCFQVADQYQRPHDFLQSLLDILRVIYEPEILGTFSLNSNPGFLFDAIPGKPFQLAYGSFISKPNQSFKEFWSEKIIKSFEKYGYNQEKATALFVVVSAGKERYGFDLIIEVDETLEAGFSQEEAFGLIASTINKNVPKPAKNVYAGYCLIKELMSRLRVSLWMFIKE